MWRCWRWPRRWPGRPGPGPAADPVPGVADLGQQRALLHMGADVEVPVHQIAVGARVDGRIGVGGHVAGQHKLVCGRAGLCGRDVDGGRGRCVGALRRARCSRERAPECRGRPARPRQRAPQRSPTTALCGEIGSCSGACSWPASAGLAAALGPVYFRCSYRVTPVPSNLVEVVCRADGAAAVCPAAALRASHERPRRIRAQRRAWPRWPAAGRR